MKAIEAAEHSDVIECNSVVFLRLHNSDIWIDSNRDTHRIGDLSLRGCFFPLVLKKIYKVGDKVTFLEALNSGMCFRDRAFCYRLNGSIFERWEHDRNTPKWVSADGYAHLFFLDQYTLCEDPSIPPKLTLESLPAWTRCKVKPVNHNSNWDVIKKPSGSLMHHYSGNDFEWVNVELIAIYNPKTEQWEDV